MNSRTLAIFAVIVLLIAAGMFFSRVVEEYGQQNKDKWQAKKVHGAQETKTYDVREVALHATEGSCWVVIKEKVYELTYWINNHPGGTDRILSICGTDASDAFHTQNNELDEYFIGNLASK